MARLLACDRRSRSRKRHNLRLLPGLHQAFGPVGVDPRHDAAVEMGEAGEATLAQEHQGLVRAAAALAVQHGVGERVQGIEGLCQAAQGEVASALQVAFGPLVRLAHVYEHDRGIGQSGFEGAGVEVVGVGGVGHGAMDVQRDAVDVKEFYLHN